MINCNPETVSTDYDTSDRLYFEPLTAEDVLEIIAAERRNGTLHGVIVQFGGQTSAQAGGTAGSRASAHTGHLAERHRPRRGPRPLQAIARPIGAAPAPPAASPRAGAGARHRGKDRLPDRDPALLCAGRPPPWKIVHDAPQLERYLARLLGDLDRPSELVVSDKRPLLIDRYLSDAIEVDVDCLADGTDTVIAGIMEHIEEAGIHSGDSACALPPHSLKPEIIAEISRQTRELALALQVGGLMNVQFAVKGGDIYVLEVNPRASRTVPFVAKVVGMPVAKIAARIMAGERLKSFNLVPPKLNHVGVKEAVFPFARFPGVDTVLGPEMKSTGEVMGIDRTFEIAFAKSQLGGGSRVAAQGHGVRVGARRRQGRAHPAGREGPDRSRLSGRRHVRDAALPGRAGGGGRPHPEGLRGAAQYRGRHPQRGDSAGLQHHRGGPRRWPTAARYGGLPSCIKCRITPLFQGPSLRRKESKPISGVISRVRTLPELFRLSLLRRPHRLSQFNKRFEGPRNWGRAPKESGPNRQELPTGGSGHIFGSCAGGSPAKGFSRRAQEPDWATGVGGRFTIAGLQSGFCPRSGLCLRCSASHVPPTDRRRRNAVVSTWCYSTGGTRRVGTRLVVTRTAPAWRPTIRHFGSNTVIGLPIKCCNTVQNSDAEDRRDRLEKLPHDG